MRFVLMLAVVTALATNVQGGGLDEVNEWRRRAGLPAFREDPEMTRFAAMKARYRAERGLKDGHQGPQPPAGWHEGTGEAAAHWGWLTCEMECDFQYAGAGVCIGHDGERYMVLVCRGGSGRPLMSRQQVPVHNTAHLTPMPDRVGNGMVVPASATQARCPKCGQFH